MRKRTMSPLVVIALLALVAPATAQTGEDSKGFSLSSSEVFTTRQNPSFYLTFSGVRELDFRVYKVRDGLTFFAGLKDPHRLGSYGLVDVPTEKTWIERLTDWKREQRRQWRGFVRGQVSSEYRQARRAASDRQEVSQRVTLNAASFALVPLLNRDQLVSAWRELLPSVGDSEMRRIPLDVKSPGVYVVEGVSGGLRAYTIVMVSDVGLVTKTAPNELLIFAANRLTGEPFAGCDVRILAGARERARGTTDANGTVRITAQDKEADEFLAVADCGGEIAAGSAYGYTLNDDARTLVGYVYTDKPVYRPGHTAHVKAVLRWREQDTLHPFDRPNVEVRVADPTEKVIARHTLQVDAFGAVHATLPIPDTAALGDYQVTVVSGASEAQGSFSVEEYRRPEFEVIVTPASRFIVQGANAVADVQARYYFGQPVANATVKYTITRQQYWSPYRWQDDADEEDNSYYYAGAAEAQGELTLDAEGRGRISVPTEHAEADYTLRIEAAVTDSSSREVSGNSSVNATIGSFMLAVETHDSVFDPGERVTATVRATDYTGKPRPGVAVGVRLVHITYPSGRYQGPSERNIQTTTVTLGPDGTADVSVTLGTAGGEYRVFAATTEDGRTITDSAWAWVPEGGASSYQSDQQYLELIGDKRTYAPGDVARIAVRGDEVSGPVLVTKEGQHVRWHRLVRVAKGAAVEVPIEPADEGDISVGIVYMREGRLYRADRRLSVPASDRILTITLSADSAVARPQQPGVFTVSVTDAAGAPVQAQVSLGVIDEAVYAVKPEQTPDPVRFFYRREYSRVSTWYSGSYYFYGYAGSEQLQLAGRRRRPFTLADFKGDPEGRPQVRKEFPDAIYWIGDLVTDPSGMAKVSLRYPDALTTWRLTARAVTTDTKLGSAISRTTTTKDVIIRLVTPRFLTEGDQVVLPTIVHNYLRDPQQTTVSIEAKGLAAQGAVAPAMATIASRGEHRDDWMFVARSAGSAVVTAMARTPSDGDAVELSLPVVPQGLRRENGISGSFTDALDAAATVTVPPASNPSGRQLRVSLAPSLAGSMLGALDYLTSFPWGCTEQTISSFLPNLVVTRTLAQLKIAPTERLSVLDRQTLDGMKRLLDLQHEDGGWGWWKTDEAHPFMTAYAVYALTEARSAGYAIDEERLARGVQALNSLYAKYPTAVPELKAYMAYALGRASDNAGGARLDEIWAARDRMSAYGRSLLLLALDDAGDPRAAQIVALLLADAQTTGELTFWRSDTDPLLSDWADTRVEATAMVVRALARRDPRNPAIDRAVRWLMLNRSGGFWMSTKQTAFALYGLLDVLQARNETPQTFTADVFVNGVRAGTHTFGPQSFVSPDPVVIDAPAIAGDNTIRIVKRGGGALYWSATGIYYDVAAAAARSGSRQLAISRSYSLLTPVGEGRALTYREQPLRGPVRPGDVLSVRLTIAGSNDWRYLAVEDPLPAGVEAIQDGSQFSLANRESWDRWWWGSRIEYRDNRTMFFQERFDEGRYEYVYLVRVISSGEFSAAPAQVSPMYVPGVTAASEPIRLSVALAEAAQ